MTSLVLRRLCEGVGVSCIYGVCEKYKDAFHGIFGEEDSRIRELKTLKLNLAYEGNEILQNLSHSLFLELEKMKRSGEIRPDSQIPDVHETQRARDPRIKDRLRLIPLRYMKYLDLTGRRQRGMTGVMDEFHSIENELYHKFTQKQLQISRAIRFYESKLYVENNKWLTLANFFGAIGIQFLGVRAYLDFVRHKMPVEDGVVRKVVAPSRLRAFLSMIPLCIAAAYLSPLDLLADTASTDDEIDVELHASGRLPSDPFAGAHIPVVQSPCGSQDHPFSGALFSCLLHPLAEGIIFRKLLLEAFLASASPLKAHFLVATAATAVHVALDSRYEHYYKLKTSKDKGEGTDDNDFLHPNDMSVHTLTLPYKPLLLQLVALLTGRLYLSVGLDCALRVVHKLREGFLREDVFLSAETAQPFYGLALELSALMNMASLELSQVVAKVRSADDKQLVPLVDKIIAKQMRLCNGTNTNSLSAVDGDFLMFAVSFHADKLRRFSMDELLPPKCDHSADDSDYSANPSRYPSAARKNDLHRLNVFSSDDDVAAFSLFMNEGNSLTAQRYYNGRYSVNSLRTMVEDTLLAACMLGNHRDIVSADDELLRRLFYWDESATEEDVLDLIQEKYVHMNEKIRHSAEEYVYGAGSLELLLLQGKEDVSHEDLHRYYTQLEAYLSVVRKREEVFFCDLYGLTTAKYQSLLNKWKEKSSEVVELDRSWSTYLDSAEFKREIVALADPQPVLRSANDDETESIV